MKSNNKPQHQSLKAWLHIGMPKTGTTALQRPLYQNRDDLRSHGFLYPDFGHVQHVAMARMLSRRAGSDIPFPKKGCCPQMDKFIDYWQSEAPSCHTAILSSEYLFQRPGGIRGVIQLSAENSLEMIRRTAEVTRSYLKDIDVNIVMWLRRQDNWLMSMYNQAVKGSKYNEDFDVFAANTIGSRLFAIVSIWVDLFGRDKVQCFSYDSLMAQRRDIVNEFASVVGLDPTCLLVERSGDRETANASLSREALEFKLISNKQFALLPPAERNPGQLRSVRKQAVRLSKESGAWSHALISPDDRLKLMSRFLEGNAKLVSELGYKELSDLSDVSDLVALKESDGWRAWPGFAR